MEEAARRVIGALAMDIRFDNKTNIDGRLEIIKSLIIKYKMNYKKISDKVYEDGRWFGTWDGPYCECYEKDLHMLGYSKDIFIDKHTYLEIYNPNLNTDTF